VSSGARERGVDIDLLWDVEDAAASEGRFADLRAEVLTQHARSLGRSAEALAIQEELAAGIPDDTYVHEEIAALRKVPAKT
jgi:hypothetical protein